MFDVMRANARQARTIRRLTLDNERLSAANKTLGQTIGRLRTDVELLALCVPAKRRRAALEFVRDHHDIAGLDEVEAG